MSKSTANAPSINLVAILGDILALFSALFYAIYLIFLKVQIKDESRIDMQLFFGYVGLLNILLCWPVGLLLHWLGVESLEFPDTREIALAILSNVSIPTVSFCFAVTDLDHNYFWDVTLTRLTDVHHAVE